jgi:hypothetical protein
MVDCAGSSEADCSWTRGDAPCTATRVVVGGGTSSVSGVGSCRTSCGGSFTSFPLMSCGISSTAVDGLPVWSGVGSSGRRSPSPANVSLPDRLGPVDGVDSSSVDTCGSFVLSSC